MPTKPTKPTHPTTRTAAKPSAAFSDFPDLIGTPPPMVTLDPLEAKTRPAKDIKAGKAIVPKAVGDKAATATDSGLGGKPLPPGAALDGRAEYLLLPIDDLHDDPDNPRKVYRNVQKLADSIAAVGLLQPISVRKDKNGRYVIMWGHRRKRAAAKAGLTHVPVIIRHVVDPDVLARQLVENSHHEQLDPIDEGRAVRRYMRINKIATYAQCGEKIGHSEQWVSGRVALLDLNEQEQEAVSGKTMSISAAVDLSRQRSGKARKTHSEDAATRATANKGRVSQPSRSAPPVRHTDHTQPVHYSGGHFSDDHPLSDTARAFCKTHGPHIRLLGGIACGPCWEAVIRADAVRDSQLVELNDCDLVDARKQLDE